MKMDIWNAVQRYMPLLIEMRRYFHCHPELSWKEDHTMAYIENVSTNLAFPIISSKKAAF